MRTPVRAARLAVPLVALVALVVLGFLAGCAEKTASLKGSSAAPAGTQPADASTAADGKARDPRWAIPVEKAGLPNLHKVADCLYRGAQPKPAGFTELKAMGVKTVVNLRLLHSDRDEMKKAGLSADDDFSYEHIKMEAWDADYDEILAFVKIMAEPGNHPVFVHCQHGADRTGTACAVYRIVFQGWTKEDAIQEMRKGGYGFHAIWRGLPKFLRKLDVERIKREAGLAE